MSLPTLNQNTNTRKIICDSNYGERDSSFAPLMAIEHDDGSVTIINTALPRGRGYASESYPSIDEAALKRDFVRRWLRDAKLTSTSQP